MMLLIPKSVGELTYLNAAFIDMCGIHLCRVDLPFIFCPGATQLLAGGHPQVQEADST